MKSKIAIVLLFLCIQTLYAQVDLSYGFKVAPNLSMHYGTKEADMDYGVKSSYRLGMSAGAFVDMQISENLSMVYEALYVMKGSDQRITIRRLETDGVMEELVRPAVMNVSYYIDYLEIPILLKVKLYDRHKVRAYANTGTAMSLKVWGKHELDGTIYFPDGDSYTQIPISEKSTLANLNLFDYSFVYGGSLEYKSKYTYFVEYRFTLGWDYLSLPTYADFPPVELRNQNYALYLGMKF